MHRSFHVLAIAGAATVLGCSTDRAENGLPERLGGHRAPALHAVSDARLRELMDEMNRLMFERMRTELEIDQERRRKAVQMANAAREMSRTIEDIVARLPGLHLAQHEQTAFLTLTDRLRSQVRVLEEQAQNNSIDAISNTLDDITTTCSACHRLFRPSASPSSGFDPEK